MIFRIDTINTMNPELRRKMLLLRKRVFCDQLHWNIPHCNGMEADIYDFTDSYYVNWLSEDKNMLIGSVRLMSMAQCNLLNTVFINSVEKQRQPELQKDRRVWEGTRLCIDEQHFQDRDRSKALIQLLYGLFQSSRQMGIETLICNCNSLMYRKYRQLGFHYTYMGATKEFEHGQVHCLAFDMSTENLDILQSLISDKLDRLHAPEVQTHTLSATNISIEGSAANLARKFNGLDHGVDEYNRHRTHNVVRTQMRWDGNDIPA